MLEFTGERYLPEIAGDIAIEHFHRYLVALSIAKGKRVLDIASGEGYGSHLLSSVAQNVTGVDVSKAAVDHAKMKYNTDNLFFLEGDCAQIPLPNAAVDLVVSFETIEHHDRHEEMFREIRRVLKPGGMLLISSPDKRTYSDLSGYKNPHHVKELYHAEFEAWLRKCFKNYKMFGQRKIYGSGIFPQVQAISHFPTYRNSTNLLQKSDFPSEPIFWLGLASDSELPTLEYGVCEHSVRQSDEVVSANGQIDQLKDSVIKIQENSNHQITYRDALVEQLRGQLESSKSNGNDQILYRDGMIRDITKQLADEKDNARNQIVYRDQMVAELQKQLLVEKENSLKQIESRETLNNVLSQNLAQSDIKLQELNKNIVESDIRLQELSEHLLESNINLKELNRKYEQQQLAMSSPFRLIKHFMNRLFGKADL